MKKLTAKIIFDIGLTVLWVVLMIYSLTGSFWHEAIGLGLMGLFVIHIGYNIPLLKRTVPNMFKKGYGFVTFKYMLDIALLALALFTGISGVLISKDILTSIAADNVALWVWLHNWAAYLTMAVIGIHIGLHVKMIAAVLARPFKQLPGLRVAFKFVWNIAAVGLIIYGFIASTNYDIPAYAAAATAGKNTSDRTASSGISASGGSSDTDLALTSASSSSSDMLTAEGDPTLEEYLGSMVCTACHRQCPLSAPQCGRGTEQVQAATEEYNSTYGSDSTTDQNTTDENATDEGTTDDSYSDDTTTDDSTTDDSYSDDTTGEDDSEDSDADSGSQLSDDAGALDNGPGDVLPIMGMYVGGTYYVTKLTGRKRKKH